LTVNAYTELLPCLPDLDALTEKVARVHGPASPSLLDVREQYLVLARALQDLGGQRDEAAAALAAARCLRRLRELTGAYAPPERACRSYRGMLSGLAGLDLFASPLLAHLTELEAPKLGPGARADWRPASAACEGLAH